MSAPERPIWCLTCQIHLAKPTDGLCPVCLDDRARRTTTQEDVSTWAESLRGV